MALTRPLAAATAAAGALGRGEPFTIGNSRVREVNAVNDALRRARRDIEEGSAALRRSEEQLRTAAEAAQFGAHEYDVVHDRTLRSPQFLKILGAERGRCRGDASRRASTSSIPTTARRRGSASSRS